MERASLSIFLATLALILVPCHYSHAELAPDTAVCNAAFAQGIRDNWTLLSENDQFQAYQSRLCSAKFSSYKSFHDTGATLGLDIPIAEALIGITGSFEDKPSTFQSRYDTFCGSSYYDSQNHQRYMSVISRVSDVLASSWNRCQDLHLQAYLQSRGVFVQVSPVGNIDQFVARVLVRTDLVGSVKIEALHPEGQVRCTRQGEAVSPGRTEVTIKDFSLTCSKDPTVEIPFLVETNFGQSNTVRVPRSVSRIIELHMCPLKLLFLNDRD